MSIQKLVSEKTENKKQILKKLDVKGKTRALGLICHHLEIDADMLEGLGYCNADFVFLGDVTPQKNIFQGNPQEVKENIAGFDFIICNGESNNLQELLEKGVVPIIYSKNCLSSLLKEFNPIKGEGNCFLYETENKWSIYASLVKYLENYRFPYDNKNLVKNTAQL